MNRTPQLNPRLVAITLLAGAVLVALVLATGGGFQTSGSSSSNQPVATQSSSQPTAVASGTVHGIVTASVKRLHGHTYQFRYTVRNTGSDTIAGFQVNSPKANLFLVAGKANWNVYGDGVCANTSTGVLVYWSTTSGSGNEIFPKHSATFTYEVNTTGVTSAHYSLSTGTASPAFGQTQAPKASTMRTSGPCKA